MLSGGCVGAGGRVPVGRRLDATAGTRRADEIVIDPGSDAPAYRQLASYFRDRIERRELLPGERLPSEARVGKMTGLSRATIRAAVRVLEKEGLVAVRAPAGVFVRESRTEQVVRLGPGDTVKVRAPTGQERLNHGLQFAEWMLDVRRSDGSVESIPAEGASIIASHHTDQHRADSTA